MYRRLLVAVDGSERSTRAATEATELAAAVDASLEGLFVVEVRPVYSRYGLAALPTEDEVDRDRERGWAILERVEALADDAGVPCRSTIKRGTPHHKIVAHADAVDADAIVLGRPRALPFRRLLGISTTERVIRHAERTVIVVR